jgi:aryl-alcohol dehydrogenase-like predicted oxidoreductase
MRMPEIPRRRLGRTGLDVTILGFGAMELHGSKERQPGRAVSPAEATAVLNEVLDAGINYLDTSPDYGISEECIGTISHRRDEFFLASKVGCPVGETVIPKGSRLPHDYARDNVAAAVEQSLRRMRTDHLDLAQVHMSPPMAALVEQETVETLRDLQRDGKVRFIGISSTLPHITDHLAAGVFDVIQVPYSALQPEHDEVMHEIGRAGLGLVVRGGVAKGGLESGRGSRASWDPLLAADMSDLLADMTIMEFMLRFTLGHPSLSTAIVGTQRIEHVRSNAAAAARGPLPADVHQEFARRLEKLRAA